MLTHCFLTLAALSVLVASSFAVDPASPRVAWTTSRVVGSPDPPPKFRTVNLFPEVRFTNPVAIAMPPGDHRWWVAEQTGKVFRIDDGPGRSPTNGSSRSPTEPDPRDRRSPKQQTTSPDIQVRKELMIDLREELAKRNQTQPRRTDALYGLAFHPQFGKNRQCFLAYTVVTGKEGEHLPDGTRISRFKVTSDNPPRIDADSEEIVITFVEGGHNGACLAFGPDGCLYISSGDAEGPSPPDIRKTGQDNTDLLSSVLRIDVDHPAEGKHYSVPKDNPFLGVKNVLPEIWAYGFRNPWKMSFDRQTGALWVGDVGWELWELVHRVERGGNYGWSIVEGRQPVMTELDPGPSPISPPVIDLPHTMAASITGGFVYRGKRFPELVGSYIFGDWETKRIWAWPTKNERVRDAARELVDMTEPTVRVITFGEANDGELCVVDYDSGTIHGFERNDVPSDGKSQFPTRLSETGLFESVADHRVAAGVIPFDITASQWSDGATAERFLALPGDSAIVWHPDGAEIPGSMFRRHLDFPDGAVLMKTFTWPADAQNPKPWRIETQLLHFDGRQWRGYSYKWNAAQTDADLVPADGDEIDFPIEVPGALDDRRTLHWTFSSRTQCLICHNSWAEATLAFNVEQLGRQEGKESSTWDEFCSAGLIQSRRNDQLVAVSVPAQRAVSRLLDPHDETLPIEKRARSYLHANCAHCHRDGGGGSVQIDLRVELKPEQLKAINIAPLQGGFGLDDAKIIAPGDPFCSVMLLRMAKTGRGRMPHLASERPDEAALELFQRWFTDLAEHPEDRDQRGVRATIDAVAKTEREGRSQLLDQAFTSTLNSVFGISRMLHEPQVSMDVRKEFATGAMRFSDPVTRDLFSQYLPEAPADRVGAVVRPRRILDRTGNAQNGKQLFWTSTTLNCKTCHRVGTEGGQVGPELTTIAQKRRREELLENLLDPSRDVDPKFAAFAVQTTDGRVFSGLVASRTAAAIQLRDAKAESVTIPATEVETVRPQRASLMPEGLLKDLTLDEAADLLAYLESLK